RHDASPRGALQTDSAEWDTGPADGPSGEVPTGNLVHRPIPSGGRRRETAGYLRQVPAQQERGTNLRGDARSVGSPGSCQRRSGSFRTARLLSALLIAPSVRG